MRNYNFDIFRTVILYLLIAFHYVVDLDVSPTLNAGLSFALPCFFVLSGYLIHHLLISNSLTWSNIRVFYTRRALRILPSYYLVLLIAAFFYPIMFFEWQTSHLLNIRLFIATLSGEIFSYMDNWKQNGIHYWSMGIEEQFYLLYPVLLYYFRQRVVLLVSIIVLCISCRLFISTQLPLTFYGALLPVSGEYLVWGALIAELNHRKLIYRFRYDFLVWSTLLLCSIFILGVDSDLAEVNQLIPRQNITIIAMLIALFINSLQSSLKKNTFTTPLIYVGKISYGIYLLHVFFIDLAYQLLGPLLSLTWQIIFFSAFVTFLGALLWELFDIYFERWRKKLSFQS